MNVLNLRIRRNNRDEYSYSLVTCFNKEVGCINAVVNNEKIQIVRFCVASKYRGSKNRYGKRLLDCIIAEARENKIKQIMVVPKPEEIYDDIENMEIIDLYQKYINLGFEFKENTQLKPYENIMQMNI